MKLQSAFALPGIVIHEFGHYLLCRLVGAKVHEVVFFQADGPSGYVVHAVPRRLRQHMVIVAGPLIVNSTLALLLFRAVATTFATKSFDPSGDLPWRAAQSLIAGILGGSIALQAIPSHADARSLWSVALDRLQDGNLLALLVLPTAAALMLVNTLRRFWIDWIYLIALAAVAVWLPSN